MKICFIAPSGYGKSTATNIIKSYFDVDDIKIGKPLYDLQDYFYKFIGIEIGNTQDGELLQFLGEKIRKENPTFLLNDFYNKSNDSKSGIIINDDCRPPDYKFLKELGFIFIKINGYRRDRDDHTKIDNKKSIEWNEDINCDYTLDNYGTLNDYKKNILNLIKELMNNEKVLHNTK